ncbi:MAG: DUF5666 domain-containing protein [bacterium]
MKYKRQIATGALAISLLVGGSSVFAASPKDLGIKITQQSNQKTNKKVTTTRNNTTVGTIGAINNSGFTVNIKNLKTKVISSIDVITNSLTSYKKDGISSSPSDLALGQKVNVYGTLDKKTGTLTAKSVRIITKVASSIKKNTKTTIQ